MKPPFLLSCAAFFNGISMLAFLPAWGVWALPMQNRLWWPIAILLFPLTIPFYCIWACAQLISSFCAFTFHQQAGTRSTVQTNGLHLSANSASQFISWHDIDFVRRVYGRSFEHYQTRFRDNVAYQIRLKSGESLYIDFVNEESLLSQASAQGIAIEGFDNYLHASAFELLPK